MFLDNNIYVFSLFFHIFCLFQIFFEAKSSSVFYLYATKAHI